MRILINCGATYNFIAPHIVEKQKIPVTKTTYNGVIMGIGTLVSGKGICRNVIVALADVTLKEDFLPFELGVLLHLGHAVAEDS